jgi:hypothetical protein
LPKLVDHADVLFPDLILLAGANIGGVTDLLLYALAQGKMNLASGEVDLESLAPFAVKQLRKILKSVSKHQRTEGVAWRFAETYWEVRREAGCWLDIAGHLKAPSIEPLLGEALKLSDPRLVAFAAVALLRRGSKVSKAVLHRVAACHETHDLLFVLLENLGQLDKFPLKYRSWDAFAAAIMVTWLLYPTELGREPRVNARKYKFFDFNDLHFSERNYTYISPLVACTYEIGQIQNPKIGEYLS